MRMSAAIAAGLALNVFGCTNPTSNAPLESAAYVWQRSWTTDVNEAIAASAEAMATFMVLAGECRIDDGTLLFVPVSWDWTAIQSCGARVVPVVRAPLAFDGVLEPDTVLNVAKSVASIVETFRIQAAQAGIQLNELQFDYDCPTSKLDRYAEFMAHLRGVLPGIGLSVTALPTWLGDENLSLLLDQTDEWILQVHSFEAPTHVSKNLAICRDDQVSHYVTQANRFGIPFRLALPTYGYDVAFDAAGAFAALAAEGARLPWPDDYTVRRVQSDPVAMASLVADLSQSHPPHLKGIVWFRLPVATDRLNWSWHTLSQVMRGNVPEPYVHAELRYTEPGLAEVWVKGDPTVAQARIVLPQGFEQALAFDTFAGFSESIEPYGRRSLDGTPRLTNNPLLIAWFRLPPTFYDEPQPLEVRCAW